MKVNYLIEFLDVAETLNYTETARRLFLTQSTLSRHMAQLEKELGFQLLDRTTRSVALTTDGAFFRDAIKPVVSAYRTAMESVKARFEANEGALRIAFPYYYADNYLQREVHEFLLRHPQVKVDLLPIEPHAAERMLLDGQCDLAFEVMYPYTTENRRFMGRIIDVKPFCVSLSSAHPLAKQDAIKPSELDNQAFIMPADYPAYNLFRNAYFMAHGIKPSKVIPISSVEFIYPALIKNNALSLRIASMANQVREGISYVPLDDDMTAKVRVVALAESNSDLVRAFIARA